MLTRRYERKIADLLLFPLLWRKRAKACRSTNAPLFDRLGSRRPSVLRVFPIEARLLFTCVLTVFLIKIYIYKHLILLFTYLNINGFTDQLHLDVTKI